MNKHTRYPGNAAIAIGIGALSMYFLDPDRGRSRRATLLEQLRGTSNRLQDMSRNASQDASRRAYGVFAAARQHFGARDDTPQKLAQRVRSRMGRSVSNPGAITVSVKDHGFVSLSGPLLRCEQARLLAKVWSTAGVSSVENHLDLHDDVGNIPGLQGAPGAHDHSNRWSDSARLLAGTAGAAAIVHGISAGGLRGLVALSCGGALLARATRDEPLAEIAGLRDADGVHIDKQLFIAAPVERVLACWRAPQDFPRFLHNVLDVRASGNGRWHWKVAGPAGSVVEWDAQATEREADRHISWHTIAGSVIEHRGDIRFETEGDGTRLRITMDYLPAAGVIGHAIAKLFGRDAKSVLDKELLRLKSYLETGNTPRDAARIETAAERTGPLH